MTSKNLYSPTLLYAICTLHIIVLSSTDAHNNITSYTTTRALTQQEGTIQYWRVFENAIERFFLTTKTKKRFSFAPRVVKILLLVIFARLVPATKLVLAKS